MAAPGFLVLAPADLRWRRRSGSASGSVGERAVSAARAARRAALKPYRKFSHGLATWQLATWQGSGRSVRTVRSGSQLYAGHGMARHRADIRKCASKHSLCHIDCKPGEISESTITSAARLACWRLYWKARLSCSVIAVISAVSRSFAAVWATRSRYFSLRLATS